LYSLIEANLVIITGCLPAMRLFLRHIAPHVFGESSRGSRNRSRKQGTAAGNNSCHVSELQTIGSKGSKNHYSRMYDYRASSSGGETATAGWDADKQSERSIIAPFEHGQIMKTDTVVVRSDFLDDVEKGALSWKSTAF
jgi:hypothetical protein